VLPILLLLLRPRAPAHHLSDSCLALLIMPLHFAHSLLPPPPACRLLLKVFPTRVKLQAPPAGPAATRHLRRLQQDAAEEAEEENYRVAAAVAASTGVALPPKSSGIYAAVGASGKAASRQEWRKVCYTVL